MSGGVANPSVGEARGASILLRPSWEGRDFYVELKLRPVRPFGTFFGVVPAHVAGLKVGHLRQPRW